VTSAPVRLSTICSGIGFGIVAGGALPSPGIAGTMVTHFPKAQARCAGDPFLQLFADLTSRHAAKAAS